MPDFKWSPIRDLPDDVSALSDGELGPLIEVWKEQRASVSDTSGIDEFTARLSREFAIETGIIEGAYTLERGVTEALIERGIDAALIPHRPDNPEPDELAAILNDHLDALEGCFAFVKAERELSTSYIKELHAILMRHQPTHRVKDQLGNFFDRKLEKGSYKTLPNNPTRPDGSVHEFCPPEHVASEMERLVTFHRTHLANNVLVEVQSAWLHHAFTQIHPFADGNGRVARMIASLVLLRANSFPLVITNQDRADYITRLEQADYRNLGPLVKLFVRVQRRDLLNGVDAIPPKALRQLSTGPAETPVEQEVAAIRETLAAKGALATGLQEWDAAIQAGNGLVTIANNRIRELTRLLQREIGTEFRVIGSVPESTWIACKEFHYQPNYSRWSVAQALELGDNSFISVVLHASGKAFRGVVAGLIFFSAGASHSPAVEDLFQTNYKEPPENAERRFKPWLEAGLARALALWRERL